MQDQSLDWEKCLGCSLTSCQRNWLSFRCNRKIKEVAKNLLSTHCVIHCEHLAPPKLSPELNDVMIRPVKTINYIRDQVLNIRLFEVLCVSMAA